MSVLKRNRSESQLEFYNTATEIRATLTKFVMSEKNIPKRWRPIFTFPTVEKLLKLIDNITAANTIYPQNLREAQLRREYQTKAIITVEQIFQMLQFMLTTLPINANKLRNVVQLLDKEAGLLRGWRKSDNKFITEFSEPKPKQNEIKS